MVKMRAVVYDEPFKVSVREVEKPQLLHPNDVIVKSQYSVYRRWLAILILIKYAQVTTSCICGRQITYTVLSILQAYLTINSV